MKYCEFLVLLCLLEFKLADGCEVLYVTQPQSTVQCNPVDEGFRLQIQCEVASNNDIYIEWYHNSTQGVTRNLGKGAQRHIQGILIIGDGRRLDFKYLVDSTITIESDESQFINLNTDDFTSPLDLEVDGDYWCQIMEENNSNELRKSNILRVDMVQGYSELPPCTTPQSDSNRICALATSPPTETTTSSNTASTSTDTLHVTPSSTIMATEHSYYYSTINSQQSSTTVSSVYTGYMSISEAFVSSTPLMIVGSNAQSGNSSQQNPQEESEWERVVSRHWRTFVIGIGGALLVVQITFITMVACICVHKKSQNSKGTKELAVGHDNNDTIASRPTPPTIKIISQLLEEEEYCTISPFKKTADKSGHREYEGFDEGGKSIEVQEDNKPEYDSLPPKDNPSYQALQTDKMNYISIYSMADSLRSSREGSFTGSITNLREQISIQTSPKYDEVEPKNIPLFPYNNAKDLDVIPSVMPGTPTRYQSLDIDTMCYQSVYSTLEKKQNENEENNET